MKAVILVAGIGSRIKPLTDNTHKSLLKVGSETILGRMIENLLREKITKIAFVTGYRADQIKGFVSNNFPELRPQYIHNDKYLETNTGYSVLLAKDFIGSDTFVKFDGDVVFEPEVLKNILKNPNPNCLCIDRNIRLESEEVKVTVAPDNLVKEVGKKLDPKQADGESIGIEKLSPKASKVFFEELQLLMNDHKNWQKYYDDTYTTLVKKNVPLAAVDVSGLKWVEIDTHTDLKKADLMFQD